MPESISKRIRINSISLQSSQPIEIVQVSFVILDAPQQYSGSVVISKVELKKLNVTVGDELNLKLDPENMF